VPFLISAIAHDGRSSHACIAKSYVAQPRAARGAPARRADVAGDVILATAVVANVLPESALVR